MKLSNASQPTCTSSSGEVHHVYMYVTCPDTGTLLSCLNIAIIWVCVHVCVCACVCVYVCLCMLLNVIVFVQMCMRRFVFTFYFLSICEHSNLYILSIPLCGL